METTRTREGNNRKSGDVMKVPSFILAAALCAIASTPAHAYFIDTYPAEAEGGRNGTHALGSMTLESWKTREWNAALSLQPIEGSLISKLGFSYSQPTQGRYRFSTEYSLGADDFMPSPTWLQARQKIFFIC